MFSFHTIRRSLCTVSIAVIFHSCTPSEDHTNTTTGTPVVVPETTEKTVVSAHRHIIEIKAMKFHPATITVNKGDTVIWVNHGFTVHDITALPDSAWTSGQLPVTKSWIQKIDKSTEYFCSLHQVMKGRITVK